MRDPLAGSKGLADRTRRARIVFCAIIVLLSGVLTVLVFREAERERISAERRSSDEIYQQVGLFVQRMTAWISSTERRALDHLRTELDGGSSIPLAARLVDSEPLIADLFFIGPDDSAVLPLHQKPFLSAEPVLGGPGITLPEDLRGLMRAAEDAEFQDQDNALAAELYRRVLRSTESSEARAELTHRLGRCYAKSGRNDAAIELYRELALAYPKHATSEGIPFGLISLLQIGNLHLKTGETLEGTDEHLALMQSLLEGGWPLSKAQFEFYRTVAGETLRRLFAEQPATATTPAQRERWATLQRLEQAVDRDLATREILENTIRPFLLAGRAELAGDLTRIRHLWERVDRQTFTIAYALLSPETVVGLRLDDAALRDGVRRDLEMFPLREGFHLRITDTAGQPVFGDDDLPSPAELRQRPELSRSFVELFPSWQATPYARAGGPVAGKTNFRVVIYLGLIYVAMAALLLGGILAINSTAKELTLAELKAEFVSTVSHELRTPVTSITYLSDLLARKRVPSPEKRQELYEMLISESRRLGMLIENILDSSKIEAGMKEYLFEDTDVADLVNETANHFATQVSAGEFDLDIHLDDGIPPIKADREALVRSLSNLLDNAVKFSGDSRVVQLRAWSSETDVFLQVRDEGIGIAPEDRDKVFNRFYRSERFRDQRIRGSGIGLAIVSHVTRAHGGDVELESELGKGTTVTLKLPIEQEGPSA